MGEIEARGELVFKEFAPLESLLKKLQGGDSASRWLEALKSEGVAGRLELQSVALEEARVDESGLIHVKFAGREDWPAPAAPADVNPVDWIRSQTVSGVWESEISKSIDSWGDPATLAFYDEGYIEKRRKELLNWWMDALGDVMGGL